MTTKKNVKKITDFSIRQTPVKKKKETPVSEQADAMDVAQEWFVRNWKLAVAAVAVIAAVVAVIAIVGHVRAASDRKARAEIASASTIASLTEVLAKHSGNPASVGAAQRLASLYLAEKDYENARKALKFVIDFEKADPYIRTRAAIDSAGILEIEGSREAACGEFRSIAADPAADEVLRAEAAFAAARIAFEMKDWSKAEDALSLINTARADAESMDPYSAWATDAQNLKEKIEAAKKAPADVKKAVDNAKASAAKVETEVKVAAKKAGDNAKADAAKTKSEVKTAAKKAESKAQSATEKAAGKAAAPKAPAASK